LISDFQRKVLSSYGDRCPKCGAEGKLKINYTEVSCTACGNVIDRLTMEALNSAWKAEKAGRYEDAAREYERLGFLDKAKALREMGKTTIVKHQYVDINHLLEQIRQGNLVVPYRCPNCQAGITINKDTLIDRLTNCPYCASALVVSDIEKFLSSIL
jgi:DNA-directed RNA polymerase subunit RPC12/RpoP